MDTPGLAAMVVEALLSSSRPMPHPMSDPDSARRMAEREEGRMVGAVGGAARGGPVAATAEPPKLEGEVLRWRGLAWLIEWYAVTVSGVKSRWNGEKWVPAAVDDTYARLAFELLATRWERDSLSVAIDALKLDLARADADGARSEQQAAEVQRERDAFQARLETAEELLREVLDGDSLRHNPLRARTAKALGLTSESAAASAAAVTKDT
jgi:hypothetical protein